MADAKDWILKLELSIMIFWYLSTVKPRSVPSSLLEEHEEHGNIDGVLISSRSTLGSLNFLNLTEVMLNTPGH